MAANDYYDFNPSPTVWSLMLTGIVLFTLALCVLLIYFVDRAGNEVPVEAAELESPPTIAPLAATEAPPAKAS